MVRASASFRHDPGSSASRNESSISAEDIFEELDSLIDQQEGHLVARVYALEVEIEFGSSTGDLDWFWVSIAKNETAGSALDGITVGLDGAEANNEPSDYFVRYHGARMDQIARQASGYTWAGDNKFATPAIAPPEGYLFDLDKDDDVHVTTKPDDGTTAAMAGLIWFVYDIYRFTH